MLVEQRVTVVVPSADVVFLMKLNASRGPVDRHDMVALWQLCTFATPQATVDAFYSAYPMEPVDEYLGGYVADIMSDAHRRAP